MREGQRGAGKSKAEEGENNMSSKLFFEESLELVVQFNEVDMIAVVWHGNYFKYFEAGRTKLHSKYGIDAYDFIQEGIAAPISKVECKYKSPLFYKDEIIVKAKCYYTKEAKLTTRYKIYRKNDNSLCTVGLTEQVFLDKDSKLLMTQPELIRNFFDRMKESQNNNL